MKQLALGLFLAFSLPLAPRSLPAQIVGDAGTSGAAPESNAQGINLQQVNAAIEADRSGLAQARADADEIRAVIKDDESQTAAIRQRLASGEASLPRIQTDLARAAAALDAERVSFEPVRARYEAARAKADAARNDARAALESRPEFRAAADAASAAASARQSAEDRAGQRLLQTDAGRRKQAEIDKWTGRVAFFEQAGPAFERDRVAAASRVQDARWELIELKARYLDSDPDVRAARGKAAAADAAVAKLRAENESRLATVPAIAAASQALSAEFGPYNAALAVLRHAESRVAAIRAAYDATMSGMAADRQTLASIDNELAHARADLTQVNADIERLSFDLSNALAAADQARTEQAQAAADPVPMAQPVLAWTDTEGLLPRVRLFPAARYAAPPRLECQTAIVTNWVPQPVFIEPTYFFVVGQPFGHTWRHHWDHWEHPHPQQQPNHGSNAGPASAAALHRWGELQTNRSALRSREASVLLAHGIQPSPAGAGFAIPAAAEIPSPHTGLRSSDRTFISAGLTRTNLTASGQPAAPMNHRGSGFRLGWASSPTGNASPPPSNSSPFVGGSTGGFASAAPAPAVAPAPAPSQAAAPAQARPAARPRR
jgi:hypothetical protein